MSIEVLHSDKREIKRIMAKNNFRVLKDLKNDLIFVKEKDPSTLPV